MRLFKLLIVFSILSGCKGYNDNQGGGSCGVSGCAPSDDRSSAVRTAFLKHQGRYPLEPGYVVHHICPLHLGGCDVEGNMRIMTEVEHQHQLQTCCGPHFSHVNSNVGMVAYPVIDDSIIPESGLSFDEDLICPVSNLPWEECEHCIQIAETIE